MAGRRRKSTKVLAFSAMLSALGVVMLYFGAAFEVLDLAMAQLASLITVIVVIEAGGGWPWLVYAVTGVLSLLLLPNKFPALIYVLFSGFYPMFKAMFERLRPRFGIILPWVLKLALFNLCLTAIIALGKLLLGSADLGLEFSPMVYALTNGLFLLYDIVLSHLVVAYLYVWRKKFKLDLK